jgi:hypothetical protein
MSRGRKTRFAWIFVLSSQHCFHSVESNVCYFVWVSNLNVLQMLTLLGKKEHMPACQCLYLSIVLNIHSSVPYTENRSEVKNLLTRSVYHTLLNSSSSDICLWFCKQYATDFYCFRWKPTRAEPDELRNYVRFGKIWGFHGGDYEECRLLGHEIVVRTSQETH